MGLSKANLTIGLSDEQKESSKIVGNNTIEYKDGDTKVIRHFLTDILRFEPDGTIVFNTNGHRSKTTKERLNNFQDHVRIWTERKIWYARADGLNVYVFADGMTYHPDRGIENAGVKPDKDLIKKIRNFAEGFSKVLPIEQPGPGDCIICMLNYDDMDHLISHIEEKYYVPRLLWNALLEANRGNLIISCAFEGEHQNEYQKYLLDSYRSQMKKDIYNYLYRRIIDGYKSNTQLEPTDTTK